MIRNIDILIEIQNRIHKFRILDDVIAVIAVFNGQRSGTKNTVDYAKRKGIILKNVLQEIYI